MKRVLRFLLACLTASTLGPMSLPSQQPNLFDELGVLAISATSNPREVPSPRGFGAAAFWRFGQRMAGRLSYAF
jgi:hypothetical protein